MQGPVAPRPALTQKGIRKMICNEAQKKVDELVDGSLVGRERDEFERHLLGCPECRSYLDWVRWLSAAARALPEMTPARDFWQDISGELAGPGASVVCLADHKAFPHRRLDRLPNTHLYWSALIPQLGKAVALVCILLGFGFALMLISDEQLAETGWSVKWQSEGAIQERGDLTGQLSVGQLMETDSRSTAHIEIASIGQVEVRPNSRVRLVESHENEQRMALEKGKIRALILAPPRLFFVETPSALAVDLGCAYELSVDEEGNGRLEVTSGWVSLEYGGMESLVPAGAVCTSRPGRGPGTPHFPDAGSDFQATLAEIDSGSASSETVAAALARARLRDTLSVWHLFARVEPKARPAVYDGLSALVPAPEGVTREGVLRLDPTMLALWKDELQVHW